MRTRDPDRFTVGDTVYRFTGSNGRSNRMSEEEVLKVGRKLVYVGPPGTTDVKDYRVGVFRIESGHENYSAGGYPLSGYVRTLAEHADDERERIARERLTSVGIRIERYRGSGSVDLTPETIHLIADAIERDERFTR